MRRILSFASLMAAGALLAAPTAGATPPLTERVSFEAAFEEDCGDFTERVEVQFKVSATLYFDRDGNPIRIVVHRKIDGTAANLSTGKTLRLHHNWISTHDLAEDTITDRGIMFGAFAVPGGPVVYLMGRFIWIGEVGAPPGPVFAAGRDNFGGDFGKVCDALR